MKRIGLIAILVVGCSGDPEPSRSALPAEDAGADAAPDSASPDASSSDSGLDSSVRDMGEVCSQGTVENENGECVECTENSHCPEEAPICGEEDRCVCTADSECPDSAPNCGTDGRCFVCSTVAIARKCDDQKPHCVEGQCLECRISNEGNDCGGQRCSPEGECLSIVAAEDAAQSCEECSDDGDCEAGLRCLEIDSARGGEEFSETVCLPAARDGCDRPFTRTIMSRGSIGLGHQVAYCAPVSRLSCRAVREYNSDCSDSGECTLEHQHCVSLVNDGSSRQRCVYECDLDDECPGEPSGTTCAFYSISSTGNMCVPGA